MHILLPQIVTKYVLCLICAFYVTLLVFCIYIIVSVLYVGRAFVHVCVGGMYLCIYVCILLLLYFICFLCSILLSVFLLFDYLFLKERIKECMEMDVLENEEKSGRG